MMSTTKDDLELFYSDQWTDDLSIKAVVVDDDDGDIIGLKFYVNDILAMNLDPDKLPIVLSRHYSRPVYEWIINYIKLTYDIKEEDVRRSILHDL